VEGQLPADVSPRDRDAALRQSGQQEMLAELLRLEREGRGRGAAMLVARKFARDSRDPVELDSHARQLRRWRRKKSGHCPVIAPQTMLGSANETEPFRNPQAEIGRRVRLLSERRRQIVDERASIYSSALQNGVGSGTPVVDADERAAREQTRHRRAHGFHP
jgi:hypothetical protein